MLQRGPDVHRFQTSRKALPVTWQHVSSVRRRRVKRSGLSACTRQQQTNGHATDPEHHQHEAEKNKRREEGQNEDCAQSDSPAAPVQCLSTRRDCRNECGTTEPCEPQHNGVSNQRGRSNGQTELRVIGDRLVVQRQGQRRGRKIAPPTRRDVAVTAPAIRTPSAAWAAPPWSRS